MNNPIPRSNLFATPVDFESLDAYIQRLPKREQASVYTAVMMALNLAHKLVEDQRAE